MRKSQNSNKTQISKLNNQIKKLLKFEFQQLFEIEIWNLFVIWKLLFGILGNPKPEPLSLEGEKLTNGLCERVNTFK